MHVRRLCLWSIVGLSLFWQACAHHVDFKQPDTFQYGQAQKIPLDVAFFMKKELREQTYEGRAWSSGIANKWVVPVGEATRMYANAYLNDPFRSFREVDSAESTPRGSYLIRIDDIRYTMAGQAAHSTISASVISPTGEQVLKKEYAADGPSGYGRIMGGGAFAQKSAIRQSSHVAFETIFKNLVDDIQSGYAQWRK